MAEKSRHVALNFSVDFDSKPDVELPIMAYLFTNSGRLLASAPVTKGKTTLRGEAGGRKDLRLFIAPAPPAGEPGSLAAAHGGGLSHCLRQQSEFLARAEPFFQRHSRFAQIAPLK